MKVACLFSGGKDSTLASFVMKSSGFEVVLITFIPENKESYMLHSKALEVVELQAKAMEIEIKINHISGEKEREVEEMLSFIDKTKVDAICSGALSSEYQKQRIDYIAEQLSIPSFAPLWHKFPYEDYKKMKIIFSSVSAMGLEKKHLGDNVVPYLKRFNAFEGGDAETLVVDAPFFEKKLELEYDVRWNGYDGEIIVKNAWLEDK